MIDKNTSYILEQGDFNRPATGRPVVYGTNGVISSGHYLTSMVGMRILLDGGNAFDAAVASAFTSMTSEFALTSAGGGGALLALPYNSEPILFDFFVDTLPVGNKILDFFPVIIDFGTSKQNFNIGKGSVAVPGNIAGLLHVHKRLGLLPLNVVLSTMRLG